MFTRALEAAGKGTSSDVTRTMGYVDTVKSRAVDSLSGADGLGAVRRLPPHINFAVYDARVGCAGGAVWNRPTMARRPAGESDTPGCLFAGTQSREKSFTFTTRGPGAESKLSQRQKGIWTALP